MVGAYGTWIIFWQLFSVPSNLWNNGSQHSRYVVLPFRRITVDMGMGWYGNESDPPLAIFWGEEFVQRCLILFDSLLPSLDRQNSRTSYSQHRNVWSLMGAQRTFPDMSRHFLVIFWISFPVKRATNWVYPVYPIHPHSPELWTKPAFLAPTSSTQSCFKLIEADPSWMSRGPIPSFQHTDLPDRHICSTAPWLTVQVPFFGWKTRWYGIKECQTTHVVIRCVYTVPTYSWDIVHTYTD